MASSVYKDDEDAAGDHGYQRDAVRRRRARCARGVHRHRKADRRARRRDRQAEETIAVEVNGTLRVSITAVGDIYVQRRQVRDRRADGRPDQRNRFHVHQTQMR